MTVSSSARSTAKEASACFQRSRSFRACALRKDKAKDHDNQRQQEEQDLQQILADPIEKLRVEIDDHISAHADLADGHEISEDAVIDQLHLGQHHLCCHQ